MKLRMVACFSRLRGLAAACMVLSDAIHVMLITHDRWRTFTNKTMTDSRQSSEVMLAL